MDGRATPTSAGNAQRRKPVSYERRGAVGVITIDSPPVNALSQAVRAGLVDAVRQAAADTDARAVVLIGGGRTFPAGADITEFGQPPQAPDPNDVHAAFEDLDKPTVAAIHGTALGGGLELALGCHYRVALPSARLGLPEVNLGLVPGAGGTQRLPRLVGTEAALDIIMSGKPLGAPKAHDLGLLDAVMEEPLLDNACAFALQRAEAGGPFPRSSNGTVVVDAAVVEEQRSRAAREHPLFEAPHRCIEAVEAAGLPFAKGLARERRIFLDCMMSAQSKALIHAFFAEREAAKVPGLKGVAPRPVERVAVLGAGTMGSGIAIACLGAGLTVDLIDNTPEALERGRGTIDKYLATQVDKGRLSRAEAEQRRARLTVATAVEAAAPADLVIEAVFEDLDLKRRTFAALAEVCRPDAVLATNTSTLDVDAIAAASGVPERVLGLHFFSPAHVMRLLEVVRGAATAPETLATGMALAKRLGKVGVVAGVCDGFIGNRMIDRYLREAYLMLDEGARPEQVDAAIEGWGFAMGPFAMMDLAGNDVAWRIRKERGHQPPADGDRVSRLPDLLCERGRFGQKTGGGWYDYPDGPRRRKPSPEVHRMIEEEAARLGMAAPPTEEDIRQRLLFALINEGAGVLADGIALRSSDIDVVYLTGYGFPRFRGGPMYYADTLGLPAVHATLAELAERLGPRWRPHPLVAELAASDSRFGSVKPGATP